MSFCCKKQPPDSKSVGGVVISLVVRISAHQGGGGARLRFPERECHYWAQWKFRNFFTTDIQIQRNTSFNSAAGKNGDCEYAVADLRDAGC